MPALFDDTQFVQEEIECARPGIFGRKGAVAQAFGIQTMAQFMGLFLGPLWGGFVTARFGWQTMGWSLAILTGVTALLAWGLGGKPQGPQSQSDDDDSERERLLSG